MPIEQERASGFWFSDDARSRRAVEVLNAMRTYRSAERASGAQTRKDMGMNDTDILALRFLIRAEEDGTTITPKDIAARLDITTASVTTLVDRLEKSGHVERLRHPSDRRAVIVRPTELTNTEVRTTLNSMHSRMIAVAESLPPEHASVVVSFLKDMTDAVEPDHTSARQSRPQA